MEQPTNVSVSIHLDKKCTMQKNKIRPIIGQEANIETEAIARGKKGGKRVSI